LANFRVLKIVPSPGKKASKSRYRDASLRLRNTALRKFGNLIHISAKGKSFSSF
jgi:hypothetical protein